MFFVRLWLLCFPLHSCPTCCWTPRARTQRLACTPCSSEKASRLTPNQSRKSSKGTSTHEDKVLVATWILVHSLFSCQHCHLVINFVSKELSSPFQVQLRGKVRLGQALPGPSALRPRSHAHLLQRDSGGSAQLHLEELQVPGVPGAEAETHQLPEHHHYLPETRQEHFPHHAQLQRHGLPPLVCLHGAAGVEWGYQSLYHLHRGPVGPRMHWERAAWWFVSEDEELGKARIGREILQVIPGAPKNPTLFIFTRHGGNSWNPLVTFHLYLDFLLMQSLKRESVLWQFKAALQWLMSYLIQELTNWWPLLSFRFYCNLSEGNRR